MSDVRAADGAQERGRRVVAISNRVPPPSTERAAGGLVAAVLPALEAEGGLWLGWSGSASDAPGPRVREVRGSVEYVTLDLTPEQVRDYYEGFCNQTLWPLMHGFPDRASINPAQYATWRAVNVRFAEALMAELQEDDLVWVHDYHFMPLGAELRARGWDGPLGYFHHIPIPLPEVWAQIPHESDIAASMRAYDLVGMQTHRDADRLRSYIEAATEDGVTPLVEGHPISIDPARIRATAARHPDDAFGSFRRGRRILLGVDRLDYTKGIPLRLEAFDRALHADRTLGERVAMVQWAAPSRAGIPAYDAERARSEELAADIARLDEGAVQFEVATRAPEEVAASMRDAEVCLVTSLSDGMNLVAKEYVALQPEADPGVLILSDGCGAVEELPEALVVPAGDVDATAEAITTALAMPLEERRRRWAAMHRTVEENDVHAWRVRFLEALAAAAADRAAHG
ncbi:MAG: trehalose-6-phosphate synthase [Dehalococcoidia bacterium]